MIKINKLKTGRYFVDLDNRRFEYADRRLDGNIDCSEFVYNFDAFLELGISPIGTYVFCIPYNGSLVFVGDPSKINKGPIYLKIPVTKVIREEYLLINNSIDKEEIKMSKATIKETTEEDKLHQLELEIEKVKEAAAAERRYIQYKKETDELAMLSKAFIESGFSRNEAIQIISSVISGNVLMFR